MTPELVFMMGEFAARFPTDRKYAKNHMWAAEQEGAYRFGFAAYAVRLLQDVYFLDWSVEAPAKLAERQQIGFIESKKAESDLFAPVAGTLTRFNQELLADPSAINVDKYGGGWLFEMEGSGESLLSPEQYLEHLAAVWEVTQRTIKGQMNE
jgi:glycine cleavage system H protein